MSLSGYDSEAVGFDPVTEKSNPANEIGSQTTEFEEVGASTQTVSMSDFGCTTDLTMEHLEAGYPEGLNEFLRRVVPSVMEQLDQNDQHVLYNTSDSDEEDTVAAKLFQEIKTKDLSTGDYKLQVLSISWTSSGNSLAVSLGRSHHETWCEHAGLVRVYTAKRSDGDQYTHTLDITEKNCIHVVKYHPKVSGLLAYGTNSGELVICNLQNKSGTFDNGTAMSASHEARITCLKWTDTTITNNFLMMHVLGSKKRRLASDQGLVSSSCDGYINVWQVNTSAMVFQAIVSFKIGAEVSSFDFIKASPLRPMEERDLNDLMVIGAVSGKLYQCNIRKHKSIVDSTAVDPVEKEFQPHGTCVLDVEFSCQKAGVFASISMDSELRLYDVKQDSPLKVICLEDPISCMGWVPSNPCLLIVGLAQPDKRGQHMKVYNTASGRCVAVEGLARDLQCDTAVTSVAVNQGGACRVAAGDSAGTLQIWDLPFRRIRYSFEDYEF